MKMQTRITSTFLFIFFPFPITHNSINHKSKFIQAPPPFPTLFPPFLFAYFSFVIGSSTIVPGVMFTISAVSFWG
jgi:hypothetical protein